MADLSDEDLLAVLGVEAEPIRQSSRSSQEERIIAGFEDIQRFVDQHGRLPALDDGGDIFERIYATRLARLRSLPDCRAVLALLDRQGLLTASPESTSTDPETSDEELLTADRKSVV